VHSGRGRGRPRKIRTETHAGEIVSQADQLKNSAKEETMIITKLSKQLTEDIVSKENNILANISFTIRGLED